MKDFLAELREQEEKLLNCVHCGFCLPACPTYTRLGDEADSPRGRLHLMLAVVNGRLEASSGAFHTHLDRCLGCRACESVCPSGVEYGHLLEGAREVAVHAHGKGLLDRTLSAVMASPALLSPAMALTRILRATGFPAAAAQRLPSAGRLGQLRLGMGMVASTEEPGILGAFRRQKSGIRSPSPQGGAAPGEQGEAGGGRDGDGGRDGPSGGKAVRGQSLGEGRSTAVLLGCVQEGLLSRVNRATVRVLEANGFRIVHVADQRCCGAIHAHTGDLAGARELARANIRAFERAGVDVVAVNAAGCGAIMKEYPHLLAGDGEFAPRARALVEGVKDISELLAQPGLRRGAPLPLTVTYDAPCHLLHAQRISREPEDLLQSIPGLTLLPMANRDECCGGAGVYGITHPELGGAIGGDKVRAVLETGAEVVATGNPGCMMQIGAGLKMEGAGVDVVHPVELLDLSYQRAGFYAATAV